MTQKILTVSPLADGGESVTTEVREINEKNYVITLHRNFNSGRLETLRLNYDAAEEIYTDGSWFVSKEDVFGVIAPEKVVRVRPHRNYSMGKAVCKGNNC